MEKHSARLVTAGQMAAWAFVSPRIPGARWQAAIRKTRTTGDYVSILRSRTLP